MTSQRKRTRTRLITAIALISASFLSAFALAILSNQTYSVWSLRQSLPPGHTIITDDLLSKRVSLPQSVGIYVGVDQDITGDVLLRAIGAGELVPAQAISADVRILEMTAVPISVHGSDIPSNLTAGEIVNLYHVGDSRLTQDIAKPSLLLSHAYILGIDRKGQNLGGDLSLTIAINTKSVLEVLSATASGRVVVVRVNG